MNPIEAYGPAIDLQDAPAEFMYMPGGTHTITASRGSKPVRVTVQVDRETAAALQAALEAHQAAGPQRPYFDFDHEHKAASAWPLKFAWKDAPQPGVYVAVEWSKPGAEAVTGKSYRAFSPAFFPDDQQPAHVVAAPFIMGGLVNEPAFKQISPLWAKAGHAVDTENQHQKSMTPEELAALQAKLQQLERENAELKAAQASSETAIQAKDSEISNLKSEISNYKQAIQAQRTKEAKAAVQAAVARGALPPKDEAVQAKWTQLLEADPANLVLLAALPDNPALRPIVAKAAAQGVKVEITREDYNDLLKAYVEAGKPRDPRDSIEARKCAHAAGLIYRKEIDGRLAAGERIPFERLKGMLPIEATDTLVGNIVCQRTLSLIFSKRPALTAICNDFSDQPAVYNQELITRTVGSPSIASFGAASTTRTDVDYPVTLDQLKQVAFTYLATEYGGTHRDLVKEHSDAIAFALGNALMDAVAALITSAFTAKTTKASASVSYSDIITQTNTLNTAGAPDSARFGIVNADVAQSLRNDEIVMANFNRNNSSAYGHWQNLEGFQDIWEYPALPACSQYLTGFFAHRDALILAARILTDPTTLIGAGYPGKLAVITDPVNGLSVLSNQYIAQDTLAITDRLIVLYGAARGNLVCGATLCSQ